MCGNSEKLREQMNSNVTMLSILINFQLPRYVAELKRLIESLVEKVDIFHFSLFSGFYLAFFPNKWSDCLSK